jgi:hypothetical protein
MRCLLCTTPMTETLHTRGAEDFSVGYPAVLYQCPACEAVCQNQLSIHSGQVWVFVNGATLTLTEDALDDPPFCQRFHLEPGIGGASDEVA